MKITFIGAGNMGGAIVKGLLRSGVAASNLSIIEKNERIIADFRSLGCRIGGDSACDGEVVVVAVKPWQVNEIEHLTSRASAIISIAAGVTLADLTDVFKGREVVRVIPNTAVELGEGVSFICGDSKSGERAVYVASEIFDKIGKIFVVDEKLLDGGMALASCGLAYALRYARASQVGGVELGVSPTLGQRIIAQTLRGVAALLESGAHPETEIDKVTTPGGITIKGLNAMEACGFTNAVIEGLKQSKVK